MGIVGEGKTLAISLAENIDREWLDPLDMLRAWQMAAEGSCSVDYIAALFSSSPLTVKRHMKLATVSSQNGSRCCARMPSCSTSLPPSRSRI
ncbi:hypothetical protein AB4Y44_39915 [Paraburkholderia sp. BR10937]|uniref:Uncharacterized protein n=1 Tax=Paraburkholderia unamae TaxID=219649 RepID=A0ACC6RTI8_9BURK